MFSIFFLWKIRIEWDIRCVRFPAADPINFPGRVAFVFRFCFSRRKCSFSTNVSRKYSITILLIKNNTFFICTIYHIKFLTANYISQAVNLAEFHSIVALLKIFSKYILLSYIILYQGYITLLLGINLEMAKCKNCPTTRLVLTSTGSNLYVRNEKYRQAAVESLRKIG